MTGMCTNSGRVGPASRNEEVVEAALLCAPAGRPGGAVAVASAIEEAAIVAANTVGLEWKL